MALPYRRNRQARSTTEDRAPDAVAHPRARLLAAVCTDQAGTDRLAGREGDRARRLGAAAGADGANPGRAPQSRTVASPCDRGPRAERAPVGARAAIARGARAGARRLARRTASHRLRRERWGRADR